MARRCCGVFFIFFLKLILGLCDGPPYLNWSVMQDDQEGTSDTTNSSEAAPKEVLGDEYEQIFHSIPTLFEYLLEILEERPQILEKDDVTFFQELPQEACEGDDKRKREVKEQCDDIAMSEDNFEAFKRNVVANYFGNAKDAKIDEHSIGEVVTQTTVIPVITEVPNIKQKAKSNGSNNKVPKKVKSKSKNFKGNKIELEHNVQGKKRNVASGEHFIGTIDWSKFYLSPEDVEEQALKTEEAIGEHNKKVRLSRK